jgi:cytosine/adenosine deaminase-related metal-dependent hydrolase
MRRFTSHFTITNTGPVLKNAIITVTDEGVITSIEDTGGKIPERASVEFYNGIIIPGFVNCHCHLELSHLKGHILQGTGLAGFIREVRNTRVIDSDEINNAIISADNYMFRSGTSLCSDICNTAQTFHQKKKSKISYVNLIEIFGIDPTSAQRRIAEAGIVAAEAEKLDLEYYYTPHSSYSVSRPLFNNIKELSSENLVTSVHFMETLAERELLENHSGPLMESYIRSGLLKGQPFFAKDHKQVILDEITSSGNLILVHNTFINAELVKEVKPRKNLFWCLCPNSNLFIENVLPPVGLLQSEECRIVIGTDSFASNNHLEMLEEIKTLQKHFPWLSLEELVRWSTLNGAEALCSDKDFGSIEEGKKPGLLLIGNADLQNLRLTEESFITRLV